MTKPVSRTDQVNRLLGYLNNGKTITIWFKKVDNSDRRMRCVGGQFAPAEAIAAIKGTGKKNTPGLLSYVTVWDIEENNWRRINPASFMKATAGPARIRFKEDKSYQFPHRIRKSGE